MSCDFKSRFEQSGISFITPDDKVEEIYEMHALIMASKNIKSVKNYFKILINEYKDKIDAEFPLVINKYTCKTLL